MFELWTFSLTGDVGDCAGMGKGGMIVWQVGLGEWRVGGRGWKGGMKTTNDYVVI